MKIDVEFQSLIPPLTFEEKKMLEESILNEGSTYIEDIKAEKPKEISFYNALIAVFSIIDSIEDEQEA